MAVRAVTSLLKLLSLRSLHSRMLAIVLGALMLPLAGSLYHLNRDLEQKNAEAYELASQLTREGVRRQEELVSEARSLLHTLALVPEIRDAQHGDVQGCVDILKPLPKQRRWTTGVWVAEPDGKIICDTTGPGEGISLGDREYFQRALATRDFVLSGYTLGKRSGTRIVLAVLPIVRDGVVRRLMGVSIDLNWYADLIDLTRQDGARLFVLDGNGSMIARVPDPEGWMGRNISALPHIRRILAEDRGIFRAVGLDGVDRIFSFQQLAGTDTTFVVTLSIDAIRAAARDDLMQGLGTILLSGLASLAAVWLLLRLSVLRWTRTLATAAERIGEGGRIAAIDARGAPAEIASVAAAFNTMTQGLATRESELEQARAAAEEAERRARTLSDRLSEVLESTSDFIFAVNREWRFVYMNERARDRIAGGRDLTGHDAWSVLPDLAQTPFAAVFRKAMDERVPVATTDFYAPHDAWYEGTTYPSEDGIVVYFSDVTQRVRDEQALVAAHREKSELLAQLDAMLENAPVGFAFYDRECRFARVNDTLAEINGLSADEHLGRTPGDLFGHGDSAPIEAIVDRVFDTGTALPDIELVGETPRNPGVRRHWLTGWFPVVSGGEVLFAGAVVMEISDLREAERKLKEATVAAESASRAKSEFLANMSHEIRTPMNAILGLVHLLQQTELSTVQADYAQKIRRSARSLLGILNDILDFSKVEAGKMDLERVEFRLDELLDNLATIISGSAQEKDIEVLFNARPEVPLGLVGDPLRLQQVLINLAGNAIKFTDEGEVSVSVSVQEETADGIVLCFAIRDTGIGIPPDQQARLFEAFSQGDSSTTRRFGGTGLGLAICARLVALMDGAMSLDSEPGRGSEFRFTARFGRPAVPVKRLTGAKPLPRGLRVMIVDDNDTARESLQSLADSFGWTTSLCPSGEAALDEMQRATSAGETYDVVLMDWRMPGIDGIEAGLRIRGAGAPKGPIIIVVTAYGRDRVAQMVAEAGLDGFIVKPVTASTLIDAVSTAYADASEGEPPAAPKPETPSLPLAGKRLLLAEDNAIGREVAREMLKRAGAAVVTAENGRQAVELVELAEERFDAVLMDVQMPEMDGFEATRRLRELPHGAGLPIIALTASALPDDRRRCLDAGMDDHIAKPLDPEELIAVLLNTVGGHHAAPAAALPALTETGLPASLPGIDVTDALRRLSGDAELVRKFVGDFARGYADVADNIASALAAGDLEQAGRLAHDLKSLSGNIGAKRLSQVADSVQIAAKRGEHPNAEASVPDLRAEMAAVLDAARILAETTPAARPGTAAAALDARQLADSVVRLWMLLTDNNFAAAEACAELADPLSRAADPTKVKALAAAVDGLDFTRARTILGRIADDLHVSLLTG